MNDQENLPREDEDVEGHRIHQAVADDATDDVEGHRVHQAVADDATDDVEGHRIHQATSDDDGDDDVEAHRLKVGGP